MASIRVRYSRKVTGTWASRSAVKNCRNIIFRLPGYLPASRASGAYQGSAATPVTVWTYKLFQLHYGKRPPEGGRFMFEAFAETPFKTRHVIFHEIYRY